MKARVVALGSGDAFCSAGRGHTSFLLEDELGLALVDMGATALAALWRLGIDPQRIDAVHFTHLHGDHIAGWPFLLIDGLYRARRTRPLVATGPAGTGERLRRLFEACYADAAGKELPFTLELRELSPGEEQEVCGRRIAALRAQHMRPPHVALSLRIRGPAGTLAFTGDTGPHPGLLELARGADVLFAECTDLRAPAPDAAEPRTAADYPRDAGRRHLSWDELREWLPRLDVRHIALAHLGAEARAARPEIEAEAAALGLSLEVCDDLWEIPLGSARPAFTAT
jgi:ribonuclease BN (tRNA processing enzyme)